jgi:hypothetical protein
MRAKICSVDICSVLLHTTTVRVIDKRGIDEMYSYVHGNSD